MARISITYTLIAIFLFAVHQSDAVITDTTCDPNSGGAATCTAVDKNAECHSSATKCSCKTDYILSSDKATCVKKLTTVTCTPGVAGTAECQKVDAHSECKTGSACTCKKEYKGPDSCTKVLGGACNAGSDCTGSVGNSSCSIGKHCECVANFIEESAVCKKALGQACTKKEDCVSNAGCDNKVCKCSAGFTKTNGLCAAESSATSAWMTTSLLVTLFLTFLPRFICG